MTHVHDLDETIELLSNEILRVRNLVRRYGDWASPENPTRGLERALRILRAEREGAREEEWLAVARLVAAGDSMEEHLATQGEMESLTDEWDAAETDLRNLLNGRYEKPFGAQADELRAEGRREAVAFLRQRFAEEGDIAEQCLEPILVQAERGDHWRGGEG